MKFEDVENKFLLTIKIDEKIFDWEKCETGDELQA